VWVAVGILYGVFLSGFDIFTSVYFSLDAISVAGVFPPTCMFGTDNDDCELGSTEALLAGTYIVVGVPLFSLFMAEIAASIVEYNVRSNVRSKVPAKLSADDFKFAYNFYENSQKDDDNKDTESSDHRRSSEKMRRIERFEKPMFKETMYVKPRAMSESESEVRFFHLSSNFLLICMYKLNSTGVSMTKTKHNFTLSFP
jgi:hypothetical protein